MTTSSRNNKMTFNGYTKEQVGKRWEIDVSLSDADFEMEFKRKVAANDPPLRQRRMNDPD